MSLASLSGFLAEDAWQPQSRIIKSVYSICEMRFVWNWRKVGLRDDFVAFIATLEDPCTNFEVHE